MLFVFTSMHMNGSLIKKKIVIFSFVYIYIFSVVFFGTFEYMSDGYGYFAYVSYTNDECVFFTIIIL